VEKLPVVKQIDRIRIKLGHFNYIGSLTLYGEDVHVLYVGGLNTYRVVNTLHFGYKKQSVNDV
jgi:hypothetical protein